MPPVVVEAPPFLGIPLPCFCAQLTIPILLCRYIALPFPAADNRGWVSALNLPNYITLSRIFSVPIFLWLLSGKVFSGRNGETEIAASALFILASITDGLDGYLARKRGQVTTMGMLLDPLADKLMIAAAFIALVEFNPRIVPAWIAVIIIGREFLVSGLRGIAASEGFTIQASELGKLKMVVQIVSVVAVILDHRWLEWDFGRFIFPVDLIARLAIWFMVGVSIVSAVDYFVAFWAKIDRHVSETRRRRSFVLTRRKHKDLAPPEAQPNH
jgi:CDP-diacylglycerol--glycerol-3-phosphate 3-phosphatidyltransferase